LREARLEAYAKQSMEMLVRQEEYYTKKCITRRKFYEKMEEEAARSNKYSTKKKTKPALAIHRKIQQQIMEQLA